MNHFVINGHGLNLSDKLITVPRNTCIITITRTGVSLKELSKKLWHISENIVSAGLPEELFKDGNTTKNITQRGTDFEAFLKSTENGRGDPNIVFRNHLQGDVLPDMLIDLDAGDDLQQSFFGIFKIINKKKSLDKKIISFQLSDYIEQNGPGVYILFVCRTDNFMHTLKELVKKYPSDKDMINEYLLKKRTEEEIDINKFTVPKRMHTLIPIIKHLGEIGIRNIDEGLDYYDSNPPPHLVMSREHSNITDKNEDMLEPLQPYIAIQKEKIRK
jgi:hypothetical protein